MQAAKKYEQSMECKGWLMDSVMYHIYPLGMLGCERTNRDSDHLGVTHRLREIEKLIPHLCSMGVNGIYFGPLFESSSHGYDTKDYFHIDRRLGDDEDFKWLVARLHDAGIRVMVDGVFNHVGREFWGFKEAMQNRDMARTRYWFKGLRFDARNGDGVRYDTWEGHEELVKLDLMNPEARGHLFDAVRWWIEQFGVDGIRLDAADCLEPDFIHALRSFTDSIHSNFQLMGEVIHGDYRKWAGEGMLHGTTNYEAYKGLWSSHHDGNFHEIAYSLNREFGNGGIYTNLSMYNFADNHDVDRVTNKLKSPVSLYSLYAMMFLMPGTPSIYYGSEWGIMGKKGRGYDADLEIRPHISIDNLSCGHVDKTSEAATLKECISKLGKLRNSEMAIKHGSYRQLYVDSQILSFEREYNGEMLICIVSDMPITQSISLHADDGCYEDILNGGETYARQGQLLTEAYPHWARVLKKK